MQRYEISIVVDELTGDDAIAKAEQLRALCDRPGTLVVRELDVRPSGRIGVGPIYVDRSGGRETIAA